MHVETRFGIGAISKPVFATDAGQHCADMCNILFQYVASMTACLILVKYCTNMAVLLGLAEVKIRIRYSYTCELPACCRMTIAVIVLLLNFFVAAQTITDLELLTHDEVCAFQFRPACYAASVRTGGRGSQCAETGTQLWAEGESEAVTPSHSGVGVSSRKICCNRNTRGRI